MIIPVRCFTCGKVIANKWIKWVQMTNEKIPAEQRFQILGLTRYCCKKMILTNTEVIDHILKYSTK